MKRPSPAAKRHTHDIRLIGGMWKRTPLAVLDMPDLRPTPSRVRTTLFNWLGQDLSGLRCLDAFAGTGALGLEAASRGASEVLLLEQHPALVQAMRHTLSRLSRHDTTPMAVRVERADALAAMQGMSAQRWDVIFLDPPFLAGQNEDTFHAALRHARRCIADNGVLHLEAPRTWQAEELAILAWAIKRQGQAGAVHHHLLVPLDKPL